MKPSADVARLPALPHGSRVSERTQRISMLDRSTPVEVWTEESTPWGRAEFDKLTGGYDVCLAGPAMFKRP